MKVSLMVYFEFPIGEGVKGFSIEEDCTVIVYNLKGNGVFRNRNISLLEDKKWMPAKHIDTIAKYLVIHRQYLRSIGEL